MLVKYSLIILTLAVSIIAEESLKDKKVVIVGAGAAGIAAAKILLLNEYEKIKILEAQDYYGGRIRTIVDDENKILELGAAKLEGQEGNVAYKILHEAGLAPVAAESSPQFPTESRPSSMALDSKIFIQSNGDELSAEDVKQFLDLIDNTLEELHNSTELVSDFYHKKFNEKFNDQQKLEIGLSFAQIHAETYSPASNWEQTTGIGHGSQKKLSGDNFGPSGGMKSLLDVMMNMTNEMISEKWNKILKLNSKVTHINWTGSKPVVTYVDVDTNEDHILEADYVIVTVPLGVLKEKHEKMFEPALPQKMTTAISSLNFGLENKIYLKFSEKWWPSEKSLHVIWRPEDKSNLELQDKWMPKIEVIAPYNDNTLMIYVMESENYHTDNLSDQELIDKLMTYIRNAFGKKGWNITDPIKVWNSKWYGNPYIRGALSYPSISSFKNNVTNSDLAVIIKSSEGRPVLFFAGEATSDNSYGTIHGAIDSGITAAKNIMYS